MMPGSDAWTFAPKKRYANIPMNESSASPAIEKSRASAFAAYVRGDSSPSIATDTDILLLFRALARNDVRDAPTSLELSDFVVIIAVATPSVVTFCVFE